MKKGDMILICIVLCLALCGFGFMLFGDRGTGGTLTVTIDGVVYKNYDLSKNQEVIMDETLGYNRFEIKDGVVKMMEADCPDQYCVDHAPIHRKGETIVCLPHKVVLEITNSAVEREVDA